MTRAEQPLRKILELTESRWDQPSQRVAVRENFRKVRQCRTPALGAEVYASEEGEKLFYHTCKSRCCPSCGNRGTLLWKRERWAALPDIPFVGIVLTMPDVLWPIFQAHRNLQHDLPAVGAVVLQQWAWSRYRVRVYGIVIQHTFGGRLNHNPHLHMMVSAGGLKPAAGEWLKAMEFDKAEIMQLWRFAVTSYLWKAHRNGLLQADALPAEFDGMILAQTQRWWNIHITRQMSKSHFLGYAGRYIRRLPISQKRILSVTAEEVVYQSKFTRTKTLEEARCKPEEFVAMLAEHVLDRYRHSMRYFGLLAPRTKRQTSTAVFVLLGQRSRPKPYREPWAIALRKHFGIDPLADSKGNRMRWVGRRKAV